MDDISLVLDDFFSGIVLNKPDSPVLYTQAELDDLQKEFGNYDNPDECPHNHVYPRLGYENSFIGEYCTQCGADLDNSGNIVRYPQIISSKELDCKSGNIEKLMNLQDSIGCKTGFPDIKK